MIKKWSEHDREKCSDNGRGNARRRIGERSEHGRKRLGKMLKACSEIGEEIAENVSDTGRENAPKTKGQFSEDGRT